MEIEIEAQSNRLGEHAVEQRIEIGHHVGDSTEDAAMAGDGVRQPVEPGFVLRLVDAEQAGSLQLDAAFPALADGLEDRRIGDDVGALPSRPVGMKNPIEVQRDHRERTERNKANILGHFGRRSLARLICSGRIAVFW